MQKKTVFFDLGNVLINFDPKKMVSQVAEVCGKEIPLIQEVIWNQLDPYERGRITTRQVYENFCRIAGQTLDYAQLSAAISDIFEPNPGAEEIVKALKVKGTQLVILSNTCEAHFEYLFARYPWLQLFDHFALSYQFGVRKPEQAMFEKALDLAKCSKETCFYTDDILDYVSAARELKIDAEQFQSVDLLKHHLNERNLL